MLTVLENNIFWKVKWNYFWLSSELNTYNITNESNFLSRIFFVQVKMKYHSLHFVADVTVIFVLMLRYISFYRIGSSNVSDITRLHLLFIAKNLYLEFRLKNIVSIDVCLDIVFHKMETSFSCHVRVRNVMKYKKT